MGKQTDLHAPTVNGEVAKLRQALLDMTAAEKAFGTAWQSMMTAYDKSGKTASAAFGTPAGMYAETASVAAALSDEMARLTIARKLAAVALAIWKSGEKYDEMKLSKPAA